MSLPGVDEELMDLEPKIQPSAPLVSDLMDDEKSELSKHEDDWSFNGNVAPSEPNDIAILHTAPTEGNNVEIPSAELDVAKDGKVSKKMNVVPASKPRVPAAAMLGSTNTKILPRTSGQSQVQTNAKTVPRAMPKTESKTIPKTVPKAIPKTESKLIPKTVPKAIPKTESKAIPSMNLTTRPKTTGVVLSPIRPTSATTVSKTVTIPKPATAVPKIKPTTTAAKVNLTKQSTGAAPGSSARATSAVVNKSTATRVTTRPVVSSIPKQNPRQNPVSGNLTTKTAVAPTIHPSKMSASTIAPTRQQSSAPKSGVAPSASATAGNRKPTVSNGISSRQPESKILPLKKPASTVLKPKPDGKALKALSVVKAKAPVITATQKTEKLETVQLGPSDMDLVLPPADLANLIELNGGNDVWTRSEITSDNINEHPVATTANEFEITEDLYDGGNEQTFEMKNTTATETSGIHANDNWDTNEPNANTEIEAIKTVADENGIRTEDTWDANEDINEPNAYTEVEEIKTVTDENGIRTEDIWDANEDINEPNANTEVEEIKSVTDENGIRTEDIWVANEDINEPNANTEVEKIKTVTDENGICTDNIWDANGEEVLAMRTSSEALKPVTEGSWIQNEDAWEFDEPTSKTELEENETVTEGGGLYIREIWVSSEPNSKTELDEIKTGNNGNDVQTEDKKWNEGETPGENGGL